MHRRARRGYIERSQKVINMRKYTAKNEDDLIKQIESDTELDKELEKEELVKGHVVEIKYAGEVTKKAGIIKKKVDKQKVTA